VSADGRCTEASSQGPADAGPFVLRSVAGVAVVLFGPGRAKVAQALAIGLEKIQQFAQPLWRKVCDAVHQVFVNSGHAGHVAFYRMDTL